MPYLLPRAPSAGCALILLTALGPASGTPAAVPAAAAAQVDAVDPSGPAPVLIPCISGTCELPLHGAAALTPLKPARPQPPAQPAPYALAAAERAP